MNGTADSTYSSGLDASTMLAGTFSMDGKTKVMRWSEEIYGIHGYRPGDVVPTLALTLAHKHPEDLPRIQALNADLFAHGGHVAIYHRLIDARLVSLAENPADFGAVGAFLKNLQQSQQRHGRPPR